MCINSKTIFYEKQNLKLRGYISQIENTKSNGYKFNLDANFIKTKDKNIRKNIKFGVYINDIKDLKNGDLIELEGKVYFPKKPKNVASYNEYIRFKTEGIFYKIYPTNIKKIGYNKFIYGMENIKERLALIYDNILPKAESSILKAMILGQKDELDNQIKDLYKNSGIYHILAISGLHIGILAIFLSKVFSLISKKFAPFVTGIVLILYCIFTGASPSTLRATIMSIIVLFSYVIYEEPDFISSICLSAIILILKNPYNLFDLGFLYSYVCVFSIAFLGGRICSLYKLNFILKSLIVSFFISIAIKPITAYYFYNITLFDFLANIIILPFMSIVVILGFLSLGVGIFSLGLAKILISLVYIILKYFMIVAKVFESSILIGRPSIIFIFGFYVMLIFIGYSIYEKHLIYKRKKFINIGLIIFILCNILAILTTPKFRLTSFDCDRGNVLVGTSNRTSLVIENGVISEDNIISYVNSRGFEDIDFLFLVKNNKEYMKNVFLLLDKIRVNNIFIPCVFELNKDYRKLVEIAKQKDITIYVLEKGDKFNIENFEFEVLSPSREKIVSNDKARLEFKFTYGDKSFIYEEDKNTNGKDINILYILQNKCLRLDFYKNKFFIRRCMYG